MLFLTHGAIAVAGVIDRPIGPVCHATAQATAFELTGMHRVSPLKSAGQYNKSLPKQAHFHF
jgi:hypothetical protein